MKGLCDKYECQFLEIQKEGPCDPLQYLLSLEMGTKWKCAVLTMETFLIFDVMSLVCVLSSQLQAPAA